MKNYNVADEANRYVEYDMIQAHTAVPSYSELRLQLLHAVLLQSTQNKQKSELFSLVTALVQLGMDTHDLIDTETEYLSESKMRSRQMKVLAGDYFSARFYHLLAKAGEIQLVGKLSEAVANVNRLKIALYEKAKSTNILADDYLQERIVINSELFKQFTNYIDKAIQPAWTTLLPLITQFEIIVDELDRTTYDDGYAKSFVYWGLLETLSQDHTGPLTDSEIVNCEELQNIKKLLVDKLDTTMYLINDYVDKNNHLQYQLQFVLEQLNAIITKYVVK